MYNGDFNPELVYKATTTAPYWEVQEWCEQHVGEFNRDWYKLGIDPLISLNNGGRFESEWFFKDEQKMLMFILRWS